MAIGLFLLSYTLGFVCAESVYEPKGDHDNRRMKKELWQVMNFENEDTNGPVEDEVFSIQPTKHPYKVR